jgi:hypothetical protein
MAILTPVVTQQPVADLNIVCPLDIDTGQGSNPITYSQIVQSLTSFNYEAKFFYVSSTSCEQVGQVYYYTSFDVNGNAVDHSMPFTLDPYQAQCAAYFYPEKQSVVFNGNNALSFTMLPGETLILKIYTNTDFIGNASDIHGQTLLGDNLFQEIEHTKVGLNFFEDYCFYILDKNGNEVKQEQNLV